MGAPPPTRRWALLRTGLGRRLLLAFALAALAPIGLLAALAWDSVGDELLAQSRNRLHQAARASGMRIIEKLDAIEAELADTSPEDLSARQVERLDDRLLRLEWAGGNGPVRRILGGGPADSIPQDRVPASGIALTTDDGADGPIVWLVIAGVEPGSAWFAAIDPGHLFDHGSNNVLPVAGEFCVQDGASRIAGSFDDPLPPHRVEPRVEAPGFEEWSIGNEVHLGVRWPLFLQARYGVESWTIAVSEPRAVALGPASAFRALVAPITLLAALLAVVATALQIRRQLIPLEKLAEGTRRVAERDFTFDLELEGDDDLTRLADAFRSMAERLASQFQSMEQLIEIDRQILGCNDSEELLEVALSAVWLLHPTGHLAIVRHVPPSATASLVIRGPAGTVRSEVRATPELCASRDGAPFRVLEASAVPTAIGSHVDASFSVAIQFPLRVGASNYGALWIWVPSRDEIDVAHSLVIGQFATQLAAAIHGIGLRDEKDRLLNFDGRTGLPNQNGLRALIHERILDADERLPLVAVAEISLDGMARVERTIGRDEADRLVRELADAGAAAVEGGVGRSREGRLAVVFEAAENSEIPAKLGVLSRVLGAELEAHEWSHAFDLPVGVAVHPIDGQSADALLEKAAEACRHASESASRSAAFFSPSMREAAERRAEIEADLASAASGDELRLFYQPIIDTHTQEIVAAEALVRWEHPRRGLVPPDEFIPLAEESGLIQGIGSWVMRRACDDIASWARAGAPPIRVSVNVANAQIQGGNLLSEMQGALALSNASPGELGIELTESSLLTGDAATLETISAIRRIGVAVSIDDFGTGYSSLAYLRRLPVDTLKLDRSFLEAVPEDEGAAALVEAILAMAQALHLTVVAEGVETREQFAFLQTHGCDRIQGYLFSPPLPEPAFREFVEKGADFD